MLGALPRLTDAFTDPLMGYISDHTRSKWGRRRPYIFVGAIAAGLIFALLWLSLIFYLAYTVFATPWVALGFELTPDYHERTRLMGVQNFFSQLAYVISPWFLLIMQYEPFFDDMVTGAAGLAIAIGVLTAAVGILPAIFLKEPFSATAAEELEDEAQATAQRSGERSSLRSSMADFFKGFVATFRFRPFLKLCAATFLVFNGFMLISSFQFYVIIYYVFGGDKVLGAEYVGYSGTISAAGTFVVIVFITWLATKIGKRRAFYVATGVSIVGYGLKWFCYDPEYPLLLLLPAPLMAFGLGGLFTLMGSMIADVVDLDELETAERREGMFGSIYWWVVKLGMAAALAGGGILLEATGFDVALEGAQTDATLLWMRLFDIFIPMISSAVAIWIVASYEITEEKAHEIRAELERRRGAIQATQ
jgi:GPH family glycoside/pentoside/hexuronide:cation symporter